MNTVQNLVRIGIVAIVCGTALTGQPHDTPRYGANTDIVTIAGADSQYVVSGPLGFAYRSIADWSPPVSRKEAISDAWASEHETVFATGPVHVLGTALGEYTVENVEVHRPMAAAWIVAFASPKRLYTMVLLHGSPLLASCAYGMACGGFHSVVAINAYTGEAIFPFLGYASP